MRRDDLIQDRYRLEAPLGRGGMAEVWRALDERLQRPVAIKFLTSRFTEDPEFLVRFFSEAQAIAAVPHAHVVRVLDFGHAEEAPFLVMELVEGGSLCDRLGVPLPVDEAVELVAQAAEGAGATHSAGVVHRDLKPGNILLDATGSVKLADFGIATLGANDHLTATGTAIGSPHYISPEGAQGGPTSGASDVYSLGIVLYELLTGRKPFDAESPTALAIAHVDETPEPPSALRPDLPAWVDALVMKCLAKDPAQRFADGTELAGALRSGEAYASVAVEFPSRPVDRRVLIGVVSAFIVLGMAGFLLASPGSEDLPVAEAEADEGPVRQRNGSPSPTPSASEEVSVVSVSEKATPTPTPTKTDPPDEEESTISSREARPRDDTQEEAPEEPEEEETLEPSPPDDSETEEPAPEETEEPPSDEETPQQETVGPTPSQTG